jgi:hypothetical protein
VRALQNVGVCVAATVLKAPGAKSATARAGQGHAIAVIHKRFAALRSWAFQGEDVFGDVKAMTRNIPLMGFLTAGELLFQTLDSSFKICS